MTNDQAPITNEDCHGPGLVMVIWSLVICCARDVARWSADVVGNFGGALVFLVLELEQSLQGVEQRVERTVARFVAERFERRMEHLGQ